MWVIIAIHIRIEWDSAEITMGANLYFTRLVTDDCCFSDVRKDCMMNLVAK